jgi:Polysaccharide biosynthesis protein
MMAERFLRPRLALQARPYLARLDALLFTVDDRSVAGRMSLIAFSIRIVNAVIAFASQVLLARWMGSFEYGIFVLVWVTMIILGSLSCLGFHTSVIRFIPEYRERGMLPELRGILLTSSSSGCLPPPRSRASVCLDCGFSRRSSNPTTSRPSISASSACR